MARSDEGTSTTTKVILTLLGVGGVIGLVCCGGLVWWGKTAFDRFKQAIEQSVAEMEEMDGVYVVEPQQIADLTASIVEIQIPPQFEPDSGEDYTSTGVLRRQVSYYSNDYRGSLVIREMLRDDVTTHEEAARILADELMDEGLFFELDATSSTRRTFTIAGQECVFEFQAGSDPDTGDSFRQAAGAVPSGGGVAYVLVYDIAGNWNEESVVAMIESIRPGQSPSDAASSAMEAVPEADIGDRPTEGADELPPAPPSATRDIPEAPSGAAGVRADSHSRTIAQRSH